MLPSSDLFTVDSLLGIFFQTVTAASGDDLNFIFHDLMTSGLFTCECRFSNHLKELKKFCSSVDLPNSKSASEN
jgi:hypothetical protein